MEALKSSHRDETEADQERWRRKFDKMSGEVSYVLMPGKG